MNYKCEVIEDLLPLYYDNICSRASRHIVEEHMQKCEICKNIYAQIFTDSIWC